MNRLIAVITGIMLLCTAPAYSQVEEGRLSVPKPANTSSFVALKTNLLYDILLIPNIGAEINIYDNWTIYGDFMYAGWNLPKAHFYWDLYGVQAGARKYFGKQAQKRSFTGHHAGIYGQALAYDLQVGNFGQQTSTINLGAGIEYGYSFPVSNHLNIDVELGVGYLTGKYFEYVVTEGHYTWRGTIQRAWVGPTKASVSLVWLIRPRKALKK